MSSSDFCVIVPTYNNVKTLSAVIDSILPYTSKLIVVNDGSTDGAEQGKVARHFERTSRRRREVQIRNHDGL